MFFKRMLTAVAFAAAAAAVPAAQAHAKLEASDPKAGSTIAAGARTLRLTFNEALEPAFSKVAVLDSANAAVAVQRVEVDKSNPKVISATLPPLRSGQYRVQWSTVTHDGHKTRGEFVFNVK